MTAIWDVAPRSRARLKSGSSRPMASPARPEAVQRVSTATPPTASGSAAADHLTCASDRETSSAPGVRIEEITDGPHGEVHPIKIIPHRDYGRTKIRVV